MVTLGERLREEREHLDCSQTELGGVAGVTKKAQINYEKGVRFPDARYLTAVAERGVDVLYVLTGRREKQPMAQTQAMASAVTEQAGGYAMTMSLHPNEQQLVLRYRKCSDSGQAALLQMAAELSK